MLLFYLKSRFFCLLFLNVVSVGLSVWALGVYCHTGHDLNVVVWNGSRVCEHHLEISPEQHENQNPEYDSLHNSSSNTVLQIDNRNMHQGKHKSAKFVWLSDKTNIYVFGSEVKQKPVEGVGEVGDDAENEYVRKRTLSSATQIVSIRLHLFI